MVNSPHQPKPSQVADSASDSAGLLDPADDLETLIRQTLTRIRNKQLTLQEQDYTHRQIHQRLKQLVQQVTQLEQHLQQIDLAALGLQIYSEDLAEIRNLTAHIEVAQRRPNDGSAPEGGNTKIASLNLQNAFELLRRLLDDMQADVQRSKAAPILSASAAQAADSLGEPLQMLQLTLGQQRQHLTNSFLGKVLRSAIAKRLNRLAGLLHRIDALSYRQRRDRQQLRALVHQIDQAVDRLDYREASAPDLLEETEVFVERRIHAYEYPWGLGWFVNRLHDITRSRSPQARVLAGLSTSLSVSLVIFLASFGAFSLISRSLESNVLTSLRLREERNEKLQTLSQQMRLLRNKEKERAANQVSLENLQTPSSQPVSPGSNEAGSTNPAAVDPTTAAPAAPTNALPGDADLSPTLDIAEPITPDSTRGVLLETDQALTSEIQGLRTTVDTQLDEISALNVQIEEARQTETSISSSRASEEQSLRNLYSWLNNQQMINHLNRLILAAFAGALGSMMSILIRLDKLDDDNLNNPFALGFLKPFIGAVFGVIVFAVLSTKVVDILPAGFNIHEDEPVGAVGQPQRDPLGDIDSQEIYKIFVAAFIAGFSERLANDTLRSFK